MAWRRTGVVALGLLLALAPAVAGAQESEPAPENPFSGGLVPRPPPESPSVEPSPPSEPAGPAPVAWTGEEWLLVIGVATLGTALGMVGGSALAWYGFDVCPREQEVLACFDDHPAAMILSELGGAAFGGALGASITGTALGYRGSPWQSLGFGAVGTLMFAVMLQPTARLDTEEIVLGGSVLTLLFVPLTATLGYYISMPNPAVIGGAMLERGPDGRWGLGVPEVAVGAGQVGVRVLGGAF